MAIPPRLGESSPAPGSLLKLTTKALASKIPIMLARYQSVFLGVGLSIGARCISALLGIFSVPILLNHFGGREYGVWVFILSISNMLAFLDLGIGNALLNRAAFLVAKGQKSEIQKLVAPSILGLSALSGIALILIFLASRVIPLSSLIASQGGEIDLAILIYLSFLLISIPLASIQRLQIGIGKGWLNPLTNLASSSLGFLTIIIGCKANLSLDSLVFAFSLAQWVILALSVFTFLYAEQIVPNVSSGYMSAFPSILREGVPFFLLQMAAILASHADYYLVARFAGTESLASYSIGVKVFQLIALVPSLFNTFLWPMYTAASARKDYVFIYRTLSRTLIMISVYCFISGITLTAFFPVLCQVWLKRTDVLPPSMLLLGLTAWLVIESSGNCVNTVQNALSRMSPQLVLALLFGISVIGCKIIFLNLWGVAMLPWASAFTFTFITMPYYALEVYRMRKSARSNKTHCAA